MNANNLLTDPESIRSNQNGKLTDDQRSALKSKLGQLPGCFTVALLFAILGVVAWFGEKTLSHSGILAVAALVGVILVTFAIVAFLGNILGGLRMIRVSIEQVPGQITWSGNRYAAVSRGRILEPLDNASNLQPGDYQFFRMRGTPYLLSAQHLGVSSQDANVKAAPTDIQSIEALLDQPLDFDPHLEPEKAAEHMAKIEQALKNLQPPTEGTFTQADKAELARKMFGQLKSLSKGQKLSDLVREFKQAEASSQPKLGHDGLLQLNRALEQTGVRNTGALSANAAGRQSGAQRFTLTKEIGSNLLWAAAIGVAWLVLSYLFFTRHEWKGLLAVTAFLGLILLYLLVSARKELSDFLSGSVQEEEGWVTKFSRSHNSSRGNSYTSYYYQVNNNNLEVSANAYQALIEGNYRVYYLPSTRTLVNIDPIVDASP